MSKFEQIYLQCRLWHFVTMIVICFKHDIDDKYLKQKLTKEQKLGSLLRCVRDIKCLLKKLFDYAVINQKSLFIPNEVIITFSHEPTHTIMDKIEQNIHDFRSISG